MSGYRNTSFAGGLTGGLAGTAAVMAVLAPAAIYYAGGGAHEGTSFHLRHVWPEASIVVAGIVFETISVAAAAVTVSLLFVAIMRPLERWHGGFAHLSSWLAGGLLVATLLATLLRVTVFATDADIVSLLLYALLVISCLIGAAAAWRSAHRIIA